MVYIYALIDTTSNCIRYVGKTVKPIQRRLQAHFTAARKNSAMHVHRWLRATNYNVEVVLLEECGMDEWQTEEQFWIMYFKALGADLTNLTKGGEGAHGRKCTLPEHRKNWLGDYCRGKAPWNKGVTGTHLKESTKLKMSESRRGERHPLYGKHHTDDTKLKLSQTKRGVPINLSVEQREAKKEMTKGSRNPFFGKKHSAETKQKWSEKRKGQVLSEAHKDAIKKSLLKYHAKTK